MELRRAHVWRGIEPLESRELMTVDLTATVGSIPARVNVGATSNVTITVRNRGNTRLTAPVTLDVYAFPSNSTFDPATATRITTFTRDVSIKARGSQNFRVVVPLAGVTEPGSFRIVAVVDPANTIAETNEDNNVAQSRVFVLRQATFDLRPTSASVTPAVPTLIAAGDTFSGNAQVRITNPSSSTAGIPAGQQVAVQIVARPFGAGGTAQDVVLNTAVVNAAVGSLAAGRSITVNVPFTVPGTLPLGSFNLVARVDTGGALTEVNESNNELVMSSSFTVVDATTAGNVGLTGSDGSGASTNFFPVNLGSSNTGTFSPVNNGSVLNSSPFDLTPTNSTGLAPVNSVGTTPVNSIGLTPVTSVGAAPVNSVGTTPLFSTGLTPTSLNNGLSSTLGGTTSTGLVGNTLLGAPVMNSGTLNSFDVTGQTTNGAGFTGLGLAPVPGLNLTPTSVAQTTTTTTVTF